MDSREDRFIVRMYDCRPDGRIKANALMLYMQEAAACHAEQLGVGFRDLDRRGCLWVLVNLRIEIAHMPKWGDQMIVTTWPSGYTRLMASREFIGRSPEGPEFFRAASDWMVLDKDSGRPKNLDRLELNLPQAGPKALATPPARLKPVENTQSVCTLRVPFSALDFNGHVNNTEYVRWALDAVHQKLGVCLGSARCSSRTSPRSSRATRLSCWYPSTMTNVFTPVYARSATAPRRFSWRSSR